jgi:hypothetical protein
MNFFERIKPGVRKRTLLLVAGCAWSIAGIILIARSLTHLIGSDHHLALEILTGMAGGVLFYFLLFARISKKHISRITLIPIDNPCFFSFFNFRSYLLMAIMISGGITIRKLELINADYIYTFFLAMGIPLLVSAYRFFYSYIKNKTGL